jgi:RNase P/RNase MRP subunit p29
MNEIIGQDAEVRYNNKTFAGKIIDETKNMIYLETEKKIIKIIKKNATFKIQSKEIIGKDITKRPEDRIK